MVSRYPWRSRYRTICCQYTRVNAICTAVATAARTGRCRRAATIATTATAEVATLNPVTVSLGRRVIHSSSPRIARVAQFRSSVTFGKATGFTANHAPTSTAWLRRRVHTGNSTSGVLAQGVHALHGFACRANIARRTGATHAIKRATVTTGSARGAGADNSAGDVDGSAINGTPGVSSWPASQGSAVAKALLANGQSCLPGWATIAQSIPLARPRWHSVSAAELRPSGYPMLS